jgi:hypothetical protein
MSRTIPRPDPGLCGACANARIVTTRTGSRFHLCGLSATDPRFPRYPRLPVLLCLGFVPGAPAEAPAED